MGPGKKGGMPQPEGTTIVMEADTSEIVGKNLSYGYTVSGLTRDVYQEYIKLASETFPKILQNKLSDTEGTFMASTEDHSEIFHVSFKEGKLSYIQYIN